jgi:hypothetical protein
LSADEKKDIYKPNFLLGSFPAHVCDLRAPSTYNISHPLPYKFHTPALNLSFKEYDRDRSRLQ